MADGGVPPVGGGGGVAGIITAVGGLVTAIGVAVAAILERRARAKAAPPPGLSPEQVADIARAVVRADREADEAEPRRKPAKRRPAKPAKPRQTKGRHP